MNYIKSILFTIFISTFTLNIFASNLEIGPSDLLADPITTSASQYLRFPIVGQNEHSMADALPIYVSQKIPTSLIKEAVEGGLNIEILGTPPPILQSCFSMINSLEEIDFNYEKKTDKEENFRRPSYYYKTDEEKALVISIMPGEDYLKQFTALVSYYVKFQLGKNPDDIIKVTSFPVLEKTIGLWTHLDDNFVKPEDTVLIGNVSDYFNYLNDEGFKPHIIEESENFYYKASRIKLGDRTLSFLRVKYSFWGNMSAILVNKMLDLGASEIIYMSKIATLDNPTHIYEKIYSPTQFAIIEDNQIKAVDRIVNPLVEKFPELDSGKHLSLATVMEQDFEMSALAHSIASSLDLEVSKIAEVVADYNLLHNREVPFTPIHWVTDYLRTKEEADLDTGFDLSNGDSKSSKEKKEMILKRIYYFLTAYLLSSDLVLSS